MADTPRSRLIKLAYRRPDLRDQILPVLTGDTAKVAVHNNSKGTAGLPLGTSRKDPKDAKITQDIRHPYYEAGDAISALKEAVAADPVTKADQKLKLALQNLKEAHDKVHEALKPYPWD